MGRPRIRGWTLSVSAVSPGLVGVTGGGQGGAKGPRPDPLGSPPFRPGWAGVGWGGEVPSVCHRSPHAANPPPAAHRHLNRPPPQRSVRPTGLVRQLQAHTWCQLAPHPSTYTGRSSARFQPRQNKFSQICANLRKSTHPDFSRLRFSLEKLNFRL